MDKDLSILIGAFIVGAILLFGTAFDPQTVNSSGGNVTTLLNVTNSAPTVLSVVVDDGTVDTTDAIVLIANSNTDVTCNASVYDPNGYGDIVNATARIYDAVNSNFAGSQDNNTHLRNDSCLQCSQHESLANNATCLCKFNVQYYANNQTWECNINVSDNGGTALLANRVYFSHNNSDTAVINELIALDVPTTQVDFGNLSATDTSSTSAIVNLTNAGNILTNVTVRSFGGNGSAGNDEAAYKNLSMICQTGNISVVNLHFSNLSSASFDDMINITSNTSVIKNMTLLQRTNEDSPQFAEDLNLSFFRMRVPAGVAGICNGTIAFQATNDADTY